MIVILSNLQVKIKYFSIHSCYDTYPAIPECCILVTTYSMLSHHARKEVSTDPNYDVIRSREWGLAILDEVHVAAAKTWNTVFVDSR